MMKIQKSMRFSMVRSNRFLLDTHIFIWWMEENKRLSKDILYLLNNPQNQIFLSVASIWEMQIKLQLGKLKLAVPLQTLIENQQQRNNVQILAIKSAHIFALHGLPSRHKDPFDRLLAAQTHVEQAVLLSVDPIFADYPVEVLW